MFPIVAGVLGRIAGSRIIQHYAPGIAARVGAGVVGHQTGLGPFVVNEAHAPGSEDHQGYGGGGGDGLNLSPEAEELMRQASP